MSSEASLGDSSADKSSGGINVSKSSAVSPGDDDRLRWQSIMGALSTQSRVIHALVLRETLSRYGDHKLGFIWAFLEPLLLVSLIVGFMAASRTDAPGGMPLVPFMVAGFIPFFMFRNTMNQLKGAINSNRSLLGFPQVTTFDVIVARVVLEAAVMLIVFSFTLSLIHLMGYKFTIENPLGMLSVCMALLLLGCGIGFVLAAISPIVPSVAQVSSLLFGRPLFLTSGLFFTAGSIPEPFRTWLLYNPVLHLLELMRSYMFYEFESDYGSWSYAGRWVLGLLVFGLLLHQALRRRAIVGL